MQLSLHKSPNKSQDFSEVKEAFRRVSLAKGRVDNKTPWSYDLSSKLSDYKARKKSTVKSEHSNIMKHMQRRINDIGTVIFIQINERKKNPFDPIVNPALFFRKVDEVNRPMLSKKYVEKVLGTTQGKNFIANTRPTSTNAKSPIGRRPGSSETYSETPTPYITQEDSYPALRLKRKLLEIITQFRIFRDSDLEMLYDRTRQANSHLIKDVVDDAISYVKTYLDS